MCMRISRYLKIFIAFSICGSVCMIWQLLTLDEEEPPPGLYGEMFNEDYGIMEEHDHINVDPSSDAAKFIQQDIPYPVIIWWTPFTGEPGKAKQCGNHKCFLTVNRKYFNHPNTQVFLYYGTDFSTHDLPIPRKPQHQWALLHEESPKNKYIFSHKDAMELFNHTSTFKRESDYPITTQYLDFVASLESRKYLHSVQEKNAFIKNEGLAMVAYIQSDCGVPSDRDHFVKMLQKYIKVDSYGGCEHNKDLPEYLTDPIKGMDHKDFYKLNAKYKFTITMENGVCDDYITEKYWRPLTVGSVPIVYGSPKIKDYTPSEKSVILVQDFEHIENLVKVLKFLDENDDEYEKYLSFKTEGVTNQKLINEMKTRPWAINNDPDKQNFIDGFECFICERLHKNIQLEKLGKPTLKYQATVDHYGCPKPKKFHDHPEGNLQRIEDNWWAQEWIFTKYDAEVLKIMVGEGKRWTERQFEMRAEQLKRNIQLDNH